MIKRPGPKSFLSALILGIGVFFKFLFKRHVKVELDYGSFIGKVQHIHRLERFYGIPFAEPPVGERRFTNPIFPLKKYYNFDATKHAPACPQQTLAGNTSTEPFKSWLDGQSINPLGHIKPYGPGQEDCLTLDITRPAGTTSTSRLPVMYFIFPGGFNFGISSQFTPKFLVKKSMAMGLPVIHVTANHRLNAFGFLGGKEVGEAGVGNLGLKDQRLTLEWIKKHIAQFGGDPEKVTIYGESSGGISVSHQLMAFKGRDDKLFRAAICQSGTSLPVGRLSEGAGQEAFDHIAKSVGCETASDKLSCLRKAPYKELLDCLQSFPGTFSFGAFPLVFGPVVDGDFVSDTLQNNLKAHHFVKVPVISGDVLDEGTILTLATLPLRTEEHLRTFISSKFVGATPEIIDNILKLWPCNPEAGSPFASGDKYALTPVYKQYAAIAGDFAFQALRRHFLRVTSKSMSTWSYIDQAAKDLPIIGAFHASELPALFGFIPGKQQEEYQTRWISFANNLNPNYPGLRHWPTYDNGTMNLIIDGHGAVATEPDNFRSEAIDYYLENIDSLTFVSP